MDLNFNLLLDEAFGTSLVSTRSNAPKEQVLRMQDTLSSFFSHLHVQQQSDSSTQSSSQQIESVWQQVQHEMHTILLVKGLFFVEDDFSQEPVRGATPKPDSLVEDLVRRNDHHEHLQHLELLRRIIAWCHECNHSDSSLMDVSPPEHHTFSSWHHTLQDISSSTPSTANDFSSDRVTQIDPDAQNRQRRTINSRDTRNDEISLKFIWNALKSAHLNPLMECIHGGNQTWRGATMRFPLLETGILPAPTTSTHACVQRLTISQIEPLILYLFSIHKMLNNPTARLSSFEQSVYGLLTGHTKAALTECHSYLDHLWANALCNTLCALMTFLIAHYRESVQGASHECPSVFSQFSLFSSTPALSPIVEQVWSHVHAESQRSLADMLKVPQSVLHTSSPSCVPFYHIQCKLILREYDQVLTYLHAVVKRESDNSTLSYAEYANFLRFATFLSLFLVQMDLVTRQSPHTQIMLDFIIVQYIHHLHKTQQFSHIAWFTSKLSEEHQVLTFSKILASVQDERLRQQLIQQARANNLNVRDITNTIINTQTGHLEPPRAPVFGNAASSHYEKKINLISWLQYSEDQLLEQLNYVNSLARELVCAHEFSHLVKLMERLPHDIVQQVRQIAPKQIDSTLMDHLCEEFKCWHQLSRAIAQYKEWSMHFARRPHLDENSVHENDGTLNAQLAAQNQRLTHQRALQQWRSDLESLMQNAVEELQRFPVALRRLFDRFMSNVGSQDYRQQMELVCRRAIPHTIFLIVEVYERSGHYEECLNVSHFVASEEYSLHKTFSQDDLHKLLGLMGRAQQLLMTTAE